MAANPNPARITEAWWWFMQELLALEPDTENSGLYGDKPGYHNTRDGNLPTDYSVRDAIDQGGPSDKSAAGDWTFHTAQRGDYRRMALYGERLRAAWRTRDPRVLGWREALGQTDIDAPPEGLDFRYHTERVPSSAHKWHWHLSENRDQVESYTNKQAMLSVLRGESLKYWLSLQAQEVVPGMVANNMDDVVKLLAIGAKVEGNLPVPPEGTIEEQDLYYHLIIMGNTIAGIKADIARIPADLADKVIEKLDYSLLASKIVENMNGKVLDINGTITL